MDYYIGAYIYSDDALQHYGVEGQKHGVRRSLAELGYMTRRHDKTYQYKNRHSGKDPLTRRERRIANKTNKVRLKQEKKVENIKSKEAKKREKEEADKRTTAQKIEAAIRSGNATEILKYADKMTDSEIQSAKNRLSNLNEIKKTASLRKEAASRWAKVEKIVGTFDSVAETAMKTGRAWNKMAILLNATADLDLPVLDFNKDNKKKKEK